jgi:hypothetical protein
MNVNINDRATPQAKMQAGIIAGIETTLAQNALRLRPSAIMNQNPSTNSASIGFHPFESHLQPIRVSMNVVAQKRRRLVHIYNENIDITIVIKVAESAAAAAVYRGYPRTGDLD